MSSEIRYFIKTLSANDVGETGGHQAGFLVPKEEELLAFFPKLNGDEKNPRAKIRFTDAFGVEWDFSFIYYNNSRFGGTRNEYRLTGMTAFIRQAGLKTGDEIMLSRTEAGEYRIDFKRKSKVIPDKQGVLKLSSSWKIIETKGIS